MRFFFILLILVPIIEIVVLLQVKSRIGLFPTIALVLGTAMLGVYLLRTQSWETMRRAQEKMGTGQLPAREMAEGLFLAVGGVLLLTPGFVTDAIGFCCLLPVSRHLLMGTLVAPLIRRFMSNGTFSHSPNGASGFSDRSGANGMSGGFSVGAGFDGSSKASQSEERRTESPLKSSTHRQNNTRTKPEASNNDRQTNVIDGEYSREDD